MSDPLIALVAEVLRIDAAGLGDESSPDNTENWDSLAAMDLVTALEDDFGIELTTPEIMRMRTVGQMRAVLKEKGVEGL